MNFQVPQFIEEKPKIVWFLNLQQFIYLAAGGGICFISFYVFNTFVAILITLAVATFSLSLAFVKINGMSMPMIFVAALSFLWKPRTYTWQRKLPTSETEAESLKRIEALRAAMGIQERMKSIALSITTSKLFGRHREPKPERAGKERFQVVAYLTGEKKVAKRIDYRG